MMSNKWAFSLTSLITIIALAFVVTPAMAGDFSTAISVAGHDISHVADEQRQVGTSVVFNVTFGRAVTNVAGAAVADGEAFAADDVLLQAYDEFGAAIALADGSKTIGVGIPANGQNYTVTVTITEAVRKLYFQIPQGKVGAIDPTVADGDDANEKKDITVTFLPENPDGTPDVLKVARVGEPFATITSAEFMVHVLLSEEPKGGFTKDHLALTELEFGSIVKLTSPVNQPAIPAVDRNGDNDDDDATAPVETAIAATTDGTTVASWRDGMLHLYLVTLKTKPGEKTGVIQVTSFEGMENPAPGVGQEMYNQASGEGRDKLTVKTKRDNPPVALSAGHEVPLKNKRVIPAGGYLIVATATGDTGINLPDAADADDNTPKIDKRTPAELKYNVIAPVIALPNLEAFLSNGGTIDLVSPNAGLVISEIMWGSDTSLDANSNSQWIEIMNTTAADIKTGDKTHKFIFYGPNETPPDMSVAANNIQDRVGTVGAGGYWSIAGKGQSGRTGVGEMNDPELVAVIPTQALISMQRVIDATTGAADGTMASSWAASVPPAVNFDPAKGGNRVATPGDAPISYPVAPTPAPTPVVVPVAMPDDIKITEIMVDTGSGRLPQWIELTNVSGAEVSLAGWSLMITNAEADADAIGETVSINLSGTLGVGGGMDAGGTMGKSLLLVGGAARSSSNLSGSTRVVDISSQVDQTGRYTFISTMAFMAALVPPQMTGVVAYGDTAGNLDADEAWEIPMDESGRSSLIRREMLDDGMATMGTDANGWVLASSTSLVSGPATWYGSDEDAGTPGYDAGGPLPVELSHFRPARDKATGAVVITWSTQSELNNAGFFIKRSQQRDGQFQVINATMVPGAGTTSEKQSYTYTDSTAQPNIVYYYQIEDVSLDGQRQTLTHGTRLKGHIGAAGKLTSTWGELKSSNE